MFSTHYDYAIIGAGAAGLQLALALSEDEFFDDKSILLLDKDEKNTNDKTWCFWEKGCGKWDEIVSNSWEKALFINSFERKEIPLSDYSYKRIQALDFYNFAKKKLAESTNISWKTEGVESIKCQEQVSIITDHSTYTAKHIFDSRINPAFENTGDGNIRLLQHFKGWEIEAKNHHFDTSSFTMMDFSVKWPSSTSFMYVLPQSEKKALVEYTFFSAHLANDEDYEKMLKNYVEQVLKIEDYKIMQVEKGVIPMSDYPFHKHNTDQITKIGTAGGWVKPSSGYSFRNTQKSCKLLIDNIKNGKHPSAGLLKKRFILYDSIFLKVLHNHNYLGESIFSDMYGKNSISSIFSFLDEETNLIQELKIISSFQKWPFTKAMLQVLFGSKKN